MVRIPTQEDLGFVGVHADRPPALVSRGEAQQIEAPGQALAEAGNAVSNFAGVLQHQKEQEDHYNATKDLIEFQRTQERALDEAHRDMDPGGDGFADTFRQSYDQAAGELGQAAKQKGYSRRVLQDLDMRLVKAGELLHTRAWHQELAERDRFHTEDVLKNLNSIQDDIAAKPDRLPVYLAQGQALIDTSRLSAVQRSKLRRTFPAQAEEGAVRARLANGEPVEAILKDLKTRPSTPAGEEGAPDLDAITSLVKVKPDLLEASKKGEGLGGLQPQFSGALGDMLADMPENLRNAIMVDEAHRSTAYQGELRKRYERGGPLAAKPGTSKHESGDAVDLAPVEGWQKKTPEYQQALDWIYQNGARYGISNPENIRGRDPAHFQLADNAPERKGGDASSPGRGADGSDIPGLEPADREFTTSDQAPYRNLSPKQRLTLINVVRTQARGDTENAVRDDIARMSRNEDPALDQTGRTSLERAKAVSAPVRYAGLESQWKEAELKRGLVYGDSKATDPSKAAPLSDLPSDDGWARVQGLVGKAKEGSEGYRVAARAEAHGEKIMRQIDTVRTSDPARSVSGGKVNIPGGAPRVAIGPDGNLSVSDGGDGEYGFKPAPEVRAAYDAIDKASASGTPMTSQAAWGQVFSARLAAQERLGIVDPKIVTRAEADKFMGLPKEAYKDTDSKRYIDGVKAAADKFAASFEPQYAKRAFSEALAYHLSKQDDVKAQDRVIAKAIANYIYSPQAQDRQELQRETNRARALQDIDRTQQLFNGQGSGERALDFAQRGAVGRNFAGEGQLAPETFAGGGAEFMPRTRETMAGVADYASREAQATARTPSEDEIAWALAKPDRQEAFDARFGRGAYAKAQTERQKR